MQETMEKPAKVMNRLPQRLHHNAWVVVDQERTRAFYEDTLGIPLTAFWIETEQFEGQDLVLSHAFYGLEDGSALAFFSMADPEVHEKFKSPATEIFNHVALTVDETTQSELRSRMEAAGLFNFTIDHGYCESLYTMDPDGLRLEFAVDSANADQINAAQLKTAHSSLKAWMAGERASNNNVRHD